MTLEVNCSDGYVAGGPWITPALGMQRLVASETEVDGGKPISLTLPTPFTNLGFYEDVATFAFPTLSGGGPTAMPTARLHKHPRRGRLESGFQR